MNGSIAIIGTGDVGATTAYTLMLKHIGREILLIDSNEARCKGEFFDLSDALSFTRTAHIRVATYSDTRDADIIIITAGARQQPDQKRTELYQKNKQIINSILAQLQPLAAHTKIIVVTNPVDLLTLHVQEQAQLPRHAIFGSGTILDTQRLKNIIAAHMNVNEDSVSINIMGEHGDSQVPVWSTASIGGIPIAHFPIITTEFMIASAQQAQKRAYEIIACKGATYYGVARCVAQLCAAILFDERRVLPVSCYHQASGLCLTQLAVIGKNGIEQILEQPLNKEEEKLFEKSVERIKSIRYE